MSTPPLLNYAIATQPQPLQINASGAQVTVVASNPGIYSNDAATNYVAVSSIVFDFGAAGTGGSALTNNASAVTYAAPPGWGVDVTGLQFTFRPPTVGNANQIFPGAGLSFTFSGITVNGATGTVAVTITENASSPGGNPPNFYPPQPQEARGQTMGLGKFPPEFSIESFAATPQAVAPGGQVQLAWAATQLANASFTLIRSFRGQIERVTQHANGQPLAANDTYPNPGMGDAQKLQIDGTSVFTLVVTYTAGGEVIQAQAQVIVDVPAPTITEFLARASGTAPGGGLAVGEPVELSWVTVAAQSVTIMPPLDGLNPGVQPSGTATVYPLDFTRYQLVAAGGQGLSVQQGLTLFPLPPGWTLRTSSAPWGVNAPPLLFALDDILYFYPGAPGTTDNPVYSSPDGRQWLLANPTPNLPLRRGAACASNESHAVVMGGVPAGGGGPAQDVWLTSDGVNWTQATAAAPWAARSGAAAAYFQSAFWLFGGANGGAFNDAWSSSDGASWTQKSAGAAWSARTGAAVTVSVAGDTLYLFGGQDGTGLQADLWTSTDGINWTKWQGQPFGSTSPSARSDALLFPLSSGLLLFGGTDASGVRADAWLWTSANGWTQTAAAGFPASAANFAGTRFNAGNWVLGGSAGVSFGRSVWVYGE